MKKAGLVVVILVLAEVALSACENDFRLGEIPPEPPPQVSVVSTNGAIVVHWSAVDDVDGYAVFVSTSDGAAGALHPECEMSPCRVDGLISGQLYYVRVASVFEGFEPSTDLKATAQIEQLSVRAGFPGPRGPFVWAGIAMLGADGESVSLKGMWFEDDEVPDAQHVCYSYWEDAPQAHAIDPCSQSDLEVLSGTPFDLSDNCHRDVCYPVLEVQADDGRFGQAFTRVVVP